MTSTCVTVAFLVLFIGGCAGSEPPARRSGIPPPRPQKGWQSPALPAANAAATTLSLGRSVNGISIDATMFGTIDHPLLIMAAIHGNEIASAFIAQRLIEVLKAEPGRVKAGGVVVIPVANPDGFAAKTRLNANRVDCNRNFPSKNFYASTRSGLRSGKAAASEPETQAIIAAIERFRPSALISIHAITDGRQCNNFDGPGAPLAKLLAQHNGYRVTPTIGYPTPGSLGSYAGIDRQIPMVTLELPIEASGPEAWKVNREALLAAVGR